jgi:hypothetical protein
LNKVKSLRKNHPRSKSAIKDATKDLRGSLNQWELSYRKESFYRGIRTLLEIDQDGSSNDSPIPPASPKCRCAGSCTVFQSSPHKNSCREALGEAYMRRHPHTAAIEFGGQQTSPAVFALSLFPRKPRQRAGWSIIVVKNESGGLSPHTGNPAYSLDSSASSLYNPA